MTEQSPSVHSGEATEQSTVDPSLTHLWNSIMLTRHINSASANLYFPTTSVTSAREQCEAEPVAPSQTRKRLLELCGCLSDSTESEIIETEMRQLNRFSPPPPPKKKKMKIENSLMWMFSYKEKLKCYNFSPQALLTFQGKSKRTSRTQREDLLAWAQDDVIWLVMTSRVFSVGNHFLTLLLLEKAKQGLQV